MYTRVFLPFMLAVLPKPSTLTVLYKRDEYFAARNGESTNILREDWKTLKNYLCARNKVWTACSTNEYCKWHPRCRGNRVESHHCIHLLHHIAICTLNFTFFSANILSVSRQMFMPESLEMNLIGKFWSIFSDIATQQSTKHLSNFAGPCFKTMIAAASCKTYLGSTPH